MKVIFKSEANSILKLSQALKYSQKLNGTTVILGKENKAKIEDATRKLEEVYSLLITIK